MASAQLSNRNAASGAPSGRPHDPTRSARPRLHSRERTMELLRRQQAETYQRRYSDWQRIKSEQRSGEPLDRLREKVRLQQELIRAQDELHREKEQRKREQQIQKDAVARLSRKSEIDRLQKICVQSIESGQAKSHNRSRRSHPRKTRHIRHEHHKTRCTPDDELSDPDTTPVTSASIRKRHSALQRPSAAVQQLLEEREEEEGGEEYDLEYRNHGNERNGLESLPWHHQQLYRMYGATEAEYFLRPKLEPSKNNATTTMKSDDPEKRARRVKYSDMAGARNLWKCLRSDSNRKLMSQDRRIPRELKLAYAAFARHCAAQNLPPIKRNFNADQDVADLSVLQDRSRINEAQDYRHMLELMYRQSLSNKDRCDVLVYNNPLPDVTDREGVEGVGRYIPSALAQSDDAKSEQEYMKWINKALQLEYSQPLYSGSDNQGNVKKSSKSRPSSLSTPQKLEQEFGGDWNFVRLDEKTRPQGRQLNFLTEKLATVPGRFADKYRRLREQKNRPGCIGDEELVNSCRSANHARIPESEQTENLRSQSEMDPRFVSLWEPLSLNAIVEYKENIDANGEGPFLHGDSKNWRILENSPK